MPLDARLMGQQQIGPFNWMVRREREPKSLADYGVQDIPFAPGLSSMVSELFKMAKAGAEHPGDVLTGRAEPSPERAMDLAMTIPLATGFVGPAMLASGAKQAAAPAFFSALSKAVDQSPLTKAPGEQWLGTLRNTPGVKPDELEWTGFADWAATQPNLTKQQAQEYLKANQVDVQEVVKGAESPTYDPLTRQATGSYTGGPKFSQWQLPGGENYRELLLTLPETKIPVSFEDWYAQTHVMPFDRLPPKAQEVTRQMYEREGQRVHNKENFKGGHYDEPNVLAHVRFNDRVDAQGKKTLVLEEIQSDWHQKGRKQGYKGGLSAERDKQFTELSTEWGRLVDAGQHETPLGQQLLRQIEEMRREGGLGRDAVPDAPFKKDWHELSLKRMIKWAADNGYDQVAWTPGKVQAARYDLSKQINEIHYSGSNLTAYDHNGRAVINTTGVTHEELPNYIGKEAAERLLSQEKRGTLRSLVGEDIKVGGEGMNAFYDKMMVNSANKLGKKFGAKVGVTRVSEFSPEQYAKIKPYQQKIADESQNHEVWSLPITDAMRTKAQTEGFPLFANSPMASAPGLTAASLGSQQKLTPEQAKAYLRGNLL